MSDGGGKLRKKFPLKPNSPLGPRTFDFIFYVFKQEIKLFGVVSSQNVVRIGVKLFFFFFFFFKLGR